MELTNITMELKTVQDILKRKQMQEMRKQKEIETGRKVFEQIKQEMRKVI